MTPTTWYSAASTFLLRTEQGRGVCVVVVGGQAGGSRRFSDLAVPFRTGARARDAAKRTSFHGNASHIFKPFSSYYITRKRLSRHVTQPKSYLEELSHYIPLGSP